MILINISIFVYTVSANNEIIREHIGNPKYIINDNIFLLRIEEGETSHYLY